MEIVEFKDKLRKLRTEAGLSQEALAEIIHISRSAIAKYENGNGNPSEETLKALAFYFGVDINDLKSDEIIKKDKKKKVLKLTGFVGIIVLIIGIITTSTVGIINLLNNDGDNPSISGLVGGTPTKLVGIYENIGLQNMNDVVPSEEYPVGSHSYIYTVNTYMSFTIEVFPDFNFGSTPMFLCGDIAEFDKDYFDFANISYDYSQEYVRYIINFEKEGYFEIKYTAVGYDRVIKFKCDNSSSEWTKYQKDMSYFYPWVNNVSVDDISSIRYEISNTSLGPNHFRNIYYSLSNNDINYAYKFLSNKLWCSNSDLIIEGGTSEKTMTYYFKDGTSQSISTTNKGISFTSSNYLVENEFIEPKESYEHRFAYNRYGNEINAVAISNSTWEYKIANFYDIEFIELLNDEEYENLEAVFTISGYPSTDILIYNRDIFYCNDKMYKIVSNENFSEVINYYYLFQAKN